MEQEPLPPDSELPFSDPQFPPVPEGGASWGGVQFSGRPDSDWREKLPQEISEFLDQNSIKEKFVCNLKKFQSNSWMGRPWELGQWTDYVPSYDEVAYRFGLGCFRWVFRIAGVKDNKQHSVVLEGSHFQEMAQRGMDERARKQELAEEEKMGKQARHARFFGAPQAPAVDPIEAVGNTVEKLKPLMEMAMGNRQGGGGDSGNAMILALMNMQTEQSKSSAQVQIAAMENSTKMMMGLLAMVVQGGNRNQGGSDLDMTERVMGLAARIADGRNPQPPEKETMGEKILGMVAMLGEKLLPLLNRPLSERQADPSVQAARTLGASFFDELKGDPSKQAEVIAQLETEYSPGDVDKIIETFGFVRPGKVAENPAGQG